MFHRDTGNVPLQEQVEVAGGPVCSDPAAHLQDSFSRKDQKSLTQVQHKSPAGL